LLCDAKGQQPAGRNNRISGFWLGHNLHAAELAPAGDLWWSEDRLCAAALALHFERIDRELRQLLRSNPEVLLERLFLNPVRAFGNRFLVTAVWAGQKSVARLEKQIRPTSRARVMMYLIRFHAHSGYGFYLMGWLLSYRCIPQSCRIPLSCSHNATK
jgi:hypothetical protein